MTNQSFRTSRQSFSTSSLVLAAFVQLGLTACSGKAPASNMSLGNANSDSSAAVDKPDTSGPSTNYGAEATNPTPGATPAPVSATPDESVSIPSVVTGSPNNGKDLEEGQILLNSQYTIKSFYSKKCLHVLDNSKNNHARLVQYTCDNTSEAKFNIDFMEHKYYRVTNFVTQKSMGIFNEVALNEAAIEQSDYHALSHQQWIIEKSQDGTYLIKARDNPNLCLDVAFGSMADNGALQLWKECDGIGQKWLINPVY